MLSRENNLEGTQRPDDICIYMRIRINRNLFLVLQTVFEEQMTSYRMMEVIGRDYLERYYPNVLAFLDFLNGKT